MKRNIDGQEVLGNETKNGGFLSKDGTIYVTPGGKVEHGVTTPDGRFIEDGTTHTMPDGSTVYGQTVGDDFISVDATTIVLGDNTVIHGHLDQNTGLFTTDSGEVYFVGKDGVTHGEVRHSDGAVILDGHHGVVMSAHSWKVDLQQLADAIAYVQGKAEAITMTMGLIDAKMIHLHDMWQSPSYGSFDDMRRWFRNAEDDLLNMLREIIHRMRISYENYHQAEAANLANLSE
jgi:hypothetical protein